MEMLIGTKAIDAAIVKIKRAGEKLDTQIQIVGLSVLAHIEEHGDVTLANRLYDALPNGSRRNALVQWLISYGKLRTLTKSDEGDAAKLAEGHTFAYDKTRTTDIEAAQSVWWHSFMPERKPSEVFDAQAAALRLIKAIQKAHKQEGVRINPVDAETLAMLDAALKADMSASAE